MVAPQHNATKPRHQELIAALVACACIALIALAALGKLPFQRKMVTAADFASNAKSDWRLVLINETHPMEPYAPELTLLRNEQAVDSRCYPDLQRMFDDMRALGLHPYVNSSYRSREVQQQVYDTTLQAFMSEGMTESEA